jgi:DNA invertase Pin-like site-specific DNA recombinase
MTTTTKQVRAGCYCRISSDPKDKRQGVDRQRDDTSALCEAKDWAPVGFYVDNDRSASNGKGRPEWERLLADVAAGKIDAIVVWNQDRGWRQMSQLEDLRRFFESLDRRVLLATTLIGDIDLYDPYGVYAAQNRTAASELETAVLKVRIRRAARQQAERGIPKWRKAFGYIVGDECRPECPNDCNGYHEDPVTAPLVREAYRLLIAGASINGDICRMLNDGKHFGLNGKPWSASTVSLFLRAPRNAGLRAHNDVIVGKGTWPGLVPEATWRAAQDKLNTPGRAPGKKSVRKHLLTGVLRCGKKGCDGYLAGNWVMQAHGAGPRAHSITYACKSCRGVSIRAEHIEPMLYDIIGGRLAMSDAGDLLKDVGLDEAEAEAIRSQLTELYDEVIQIGIERGQRLLTGQQAKDATDIVKADIAKLERRQQDQEIMQVFEGIPLGTPEAVVSVRKLSPDRFRAVVDLMMAPVVKPVGKGGHVFNPDRLVQNWRR